MCPYQSMLEPVGTLMARISTRSRVFLFHIVNRLLVLIVLLLIFSPLVGAEQVRGLTIKSAIGSAATGYPVNTQNALMNTASKTGAETPKTLHAPSELVNPDWRTRFLLAITDPTVTYFLILLGIYGIFFEFVNPGFVLPGVLGTLSLLLALYALQLLPINYAGLGLIVLGIVFIIAEGFAPSFGALGLGGTITFVLGSILFINTDQAPNHIAWSVIWAMAVVNIVIFVFLVGMVAKSRRQTVKNGLVMLVGAKGRTLGEVNLHGQAVIRGEIWSVYAQSPIPADTNIKVILASGLLLEVEEDLPVK